VVARALARSMTGPRLLRHRASTPAHSLAAGASAQSLPGDLLLQTCRRVYAVGLVSGALWTVSLVINSLMGRLGGRPAVLEAIWPWPGVPIALLGIALAASLSWLARRLRHRPQLLLDLSAGYLVLNCLLTGILTQWLPPAITPRVSWLCILILIYPAIVPMSPRRTLLVAAVAASMEPLALGISALRGVPVDTSLVYLMWSFLPSYLCAVMAVVPARIIRGLGQQVRRARELGSYRLEEVLGKGGMGEVYRASHQLLARPAAVKLIRPEVLGESAPDRARVILERFRREAQASAALRSPHTIDLYDFGAAQDGTFFLVMELLEGIDVDLLVERFGPQSPERTAHLLIQACHSLEEAHQRGLIHRDIKPSNIFTCRMGLEVDFVKVLDFGLVKAQGEEFRNDVLLTAPNATAGTPAFIAPEVAQGEAAIDHRVDIYALGCVAYWLLTGQLVFSARQPLQQLLQHISATPAPPSSRIELPIPPAMDELVLACLAKRPADRPANARALAHALAEIETEPWGEAQAAQWWRDHRPA
ncbi:MAG TPA: serine/threonine-protein kinase, partial [Gemmatimonadales bacterium]|nr:serine/threonine-protein kinase [Gemmatimonadales bacterium]